MINYNVFYGSTIHSMIRVAIVALEQDVISNFIYNKMSVGKFFYVVRTSN